MKLRDILPRWMAVSWRDLARGTVCSHEHKGTYSGCFHARTGQLVHVYSVPGAPASRPVVDHIYGPRRDHIACSNTYMCCYMGKISGRLQLYRGPTWESESQRCHCAFSHVVNQVLNRWQISKGAACALDTRIAVTLATASGNQFLWAGMITSVHANYRCRIPSDGCTGVETVITVIHKLISAEYGLTRESP
jgi:hypothetical protein